MENMEHMDNELNSENENIVTGKMHIMKTLEPVKEKLEPVKEKLEPVKEKLKPVKEKLNRKILVPVALILIILIGAISGIRYATNNYMTPIRSIEKLENQSSINAKKFMKTSLKDLGVKNADEIINILYESDAFLDMMDELEAAIEEAYEKNLDDYGDDFKLTYTVEEKIEMEKSDLRDYQKEFRQFVKDIEEELDETDDFTSDDWEDLADDFGLTRTQAKKLVSAIKKAVKEIGRPEVTAGYEVDILETRTGEMLDEPEETNSTVRVVKINGRWIYLDIYGSLFAIFDF